MGKQKVYNLPNQVHFITTNVFQRIPIFSNVDYCKIVIQKINFYRKRYDFKLIGYVIMPDHIHLLIQPPEKQNVSSIIRDLKRSIAMEIINHLKGENKAGPLKSLKLPNIKSKNHTFSLWQRRFIDFNIFSEKKLYEKLEYIHNNPVRDKLVSSPSDWIFSSYRNYFEEDDSIIAVDRIVMTYSPVEK
ncbi:MAG: transposase [candidate division Zixibacteria bacterium]|nr:transposase [candidate division Zixibacteria bacterium]